MYFVIQGWGSSGVGNLFREYGTLYVFVIHMQYVLCVFGICVGFVLVQIYCGAAAGPGVGGDAVAVGECLINTFTSHCM